MGSQRDPVLRYLSRDVSKDRAAMLALDNPMNADFTTRITPVDLSFINNALLTSRRVFPIDSLLESSKNVRKNLVKRQMPLSKITVMEDSTVSIKQPRLNASSSRRQGAQSFPPILVIAGINEKNKT